MTLRPMDPTELALRNAVTALKNAAHQCLLATQPLIARLEEIHPPEKRTRPTDEYRVPNFDKGVWEVHNQKTGRWLRNESMEDR